MRRRDLQPANTYTVSWLSGSQLPHPSYACSTAAGVGLPSGRPVFVYVPVLQTLSQSPPVQGAEQTRCKNLAGNPQFLASKILLFFNQCKSLQALLRLYKTWSKKVMPLKEVNKFNNALETLEQVRAVNCLIQGMCSRMRESEMSESEAVGLFVLLDWQNKHVEAAEGIIKTVYSNQVASIKAA
jgi:hypothetical protein